jgi:hypothetical protein
MLGGIPMHPKLKIFLFSLMAIALIIILIIGPIYQKNKLNSILANKLDNKEAVEVEVPVEIEEPMINYLYENEEIGIYVEDLPNWELQEIKDERGLNVIFTSKQVTAIITAISNNRSLEEMKEELMQGAGDVEWITEEENHFAYRSLQTESIRTDVYFKQLKDYYILYTFITPEKDYEQSKLLIDSFLDSASLGGEKGEE